MNKINQNRFNWMVTIYLLLIIGILWMPHAHASYSDGYRMGQLTKFSVKGLMTKSGEGQLSMGREGTPLVKYYSCGDKGKKCKKVINPWYFSSTTSKSKSLNALAGEYVVIEYNQATINNPLAYNTDYRVKNVYKVDKSIDLGDGYEVSKFGGDKSAGFRIGRIVKASSKGHIKKTYELIVQVGNSGNQYKHMSTSDKKMYDYAIKVLKSAQKVKLFYAERAFYQVSWNNTGYEIYKIQPLSDI